jgi:hypothetical protein
MSIRKWGLICLLTNSLVTLGCKPSERLKFSELEIEILEEYRLEGIIVGVKHYCLPWGMGTLPLLKDVEPLFGWSTEVLPVDIAVITAPYDTPNVLKDFNTIMRDRYAWFLPRHKNYTYPPKEHITNNHLLANNPKINRKIMKLKRGQKIILTGHLIKIKFPDGREMMSSLSRSDEGYAPVWNRGTPGVPGGACEVILVNSIKIKNTRSTDIFTGPSKP